MESFGAFEAKTHFSEILAEVRKGNKFVITKHGVKVAMIVPYSKEEEGFDPARNAIRAFKSLRKGITLGPGLSIRKMINTGRK